MSDPMTDTELAEIRAVTDSGHALQPIHTARLLAELDRRAGLMREAVAVIPSSSAAWSAIKGHYFECPQCNAAGNPEIFHNPNCLIERLRTAGEG